MKIFLISAVVILLLCACSKEQLPPEPKYPYNMYDEDVHSFCSLIMEGDKSGLEPKNLVFSKEDGLDALKEIWGKVEGYTITKTIHISAKAYYFMDLQIKNVGKRKYRICYYPDASKIFIAFQKL